MGLLERPDLGRHALRNLDDHAQLAQCCHGQQWHARRHGFACLDVPGRDDAVVGRPQLGVRDAFACRFEPGLCGREIRARGVACGHRLVIGRTRHDLALVHVTDAVELGAGLCVLRDCRLQRRLGLSEACHLLGRTQPHQQRPGLDRDR